MLDRTNANVLSYARVSDDGETVTPAGRLLVVTDTEPVKPLLAFTETCTFWKAPPCIRLMVAGDNEIEKPGVGGGGGVEIESPPPAPQFVARITRKEALHTQRNLRIRMIDRPFNVRAGKSSSSSYPV